MALFSARINNRYYLINKFSKIWIFFSFTVQLLLFIFPIAQKILLYTMPAFTLIFLIVWSIRFDYIKSPAFILGVVFVCWYLLTRFLNKERFYPAFYLYFFEIATAYFIYLPFAFCTEDYKDTVLFNRVSLLVVVFITFLASLGVVSAIFNTSVRLPGLDYSTDMSYWDGRLEILDINPNIIAMILIVALMLEIYLFLRFYSNRVIYRVLIFACFILCYWALALTGSRGAEYGLVVAAPFISFLFLEKYIKRLKFRFLFNIILVVLSLVLTFCSFSWTTSLLSDISSFVTGNMVTSTEIEDSSLFDEGNDGAIIQERTTIIDTTLNLRTDIYKGFFDYSMTHGKLYLFGLKERTIQTITYKMTGINQPHLHCSFLQTLALTGVLGLVIILAILVILLIYALKMFFLKDLTLSERFIPVILIPMLVHSCIESYLFVPVYEYSYMMFENNIFLFVSGYVVAKGMQLKSRKEK